MKQLILLVLCLLQFKNCVCPTSEAISRVTIYSGTWKPGSYGSAPKDNVVGAVDPLDNEQQSVCRHPQDGNMVPGKLVPSHGKCYIPRSGKEWGFSEYEVLVNDASFDLKWYDNSNGNFHSGAILGGFAGGWPMMICRAWHLGRQNTYRWVNGKLDTQPGYECCYIPYAGKEHCYKNYQVLIGGV